MRGNAMTRAQYGFAVGFSVALVWAVAGFLVMVGAVVAGLIGFGVVRVMEGRVDLTALVDRLSAGRR
jgi:hypothetical protein